MQEINTSPLYQSMPVTSDEVYATALHEDKIRNILSQIDPENQLYDIMQRIKGYYKDPNLGWVKLHGQVGGVSDLLIARYISFLSSLMNQNTTFSNLSAEHINRIMEMNIHYIIDDLEAHAEEYGINNNYSERTRIGLIMLNGMFMVMNRSLNGQEARRFWGSLTLGENLNVNQAQGKKGFLEAMKFWK